MIEFWQSYYRSLLAIIKDRNIMLLMIIGPIVYSFYYPLPYSPEIVRNIPVAIADLDHTSLSRQLVRLAKASPDLNVVAVVNDPAEIQQALWRGDIEGGLIIPNNFRRDVMRGKTATTVVLGNGAYFMLNRGQLLGFTGATQALSSQLKLKHALATTPSSQQAAERNQPIRLDLRAASNPTGGYSTYVVPSVAVIVLQQTLLLGICMLLGTWRESGAPFNMAVRKNRWALVFAAATLCLLNTLYYVGIVFWREDYPHVAQLRDLLPVIFIFSLCAAAWSVAVGSFIRYRLQAILHLIPTSIPIIFLAGFAWPVELIPVPLVALSLLIPSTASIQAFLNVNQMGASLLQVWPEIVSLCTLTIGMAIVISLRKNWPTEIK